MKVFEVAAVSVQILKSNPPQLAISVIGNASTPGWTDIVLQIDDRDPNDDVLELSLVGTPPSGIVPQVVVPVGAQLLYSHADVAKIAVVLVRGRTNEKSIHLGTTSATRYPTDNSRVRKVAAWPPSVPSTRAWGEEGPWPTWYFGEHFPTHPAMDDPITTLAFQIGEEMPPTDPAIDDPGPIPHAGMNPFGDE
jgi:hypothetical protein